MLHCQGTQQPDILVVAQPKQSLQVPLKNFLLVGHISIFEHPHCLCANYLLNCVSPKLIEISLFNPKNRDQSLKFAYLRFRELMIRNAVACEDESKIEKNFFEIRSTR